MKILIIDNYDSFTYNLAQLVYQETQTTPIIIRNDQIDYDSIAKMAFDGIVVSAGPGRPENLDDLGVAREVIIKATKPVLGICLGMQAIVHYHGGSIQYAPEQMHGRTSAIYHNADGLFESIPQQFTAMRYHSLTVDSNLPADLRCTAWTDDNIVMAVQHNSKPLWGVQFHPESISTSFGNTLMGNFIRHIDPNHTIRVAKNKTSKKIIRKKTHRIRVKKYHRWIDPAEVFEQLYSDSEYCFWLDSNDKQHDLSNISYMGDTATPTSHTVKYYNNSEQLLINDQAHTSQHIFDYLDNCLKKYFCEPTDLPFAFSGGYVGWFGYELNGQYINQAATSSLPQPDAAFLYTECFIVFDHNEKSISLVTVPLDKQDTSNKDEYSTWTDATIAKLDAIAAEPPLATTMTRSTEQQRTVEFTISKSRGDYINTIKLAKEKIRQGESYELCLTNKLACGINNTGFEIYKSLRQNNPAPFSSYLKFFDIEVLSSSPERFLALDQDRKVSSKPIKGTISRDKDTHTDARNKHFLQTNIKDQAENLMIVDLLRNDLNKVCQYGSVRVPKLLDIESYPTVHQLVSTIEGMLDNEMTMIDCIKACFPGGSMTGAPKIRSMQILQELEGQARGIYSGALGYLSLNGCCDLSIVIRTIIAHKSQASIGCGGAIVALSNNEQEYQEILLKAKSLIEAIVTTETGEYKPQNFLISE